MIKLTRDNLTSLQVAVPLEDLCKTFQDAIQLVGRFGIKYLWIDSLFIIQADEEDWRSEAGKIRTVYSQSALNIAATGAKDRSRGLYFSGMQRQFPSAASRLSEAQ
jgi:hypothetical protein